MTSSGSKISRKVGPGGPTVESIIVRPYLKVNGTSGLWRCLTQPLALSVKIALCARGAS